MNSTHTSKMEESNGEIIPGPQGSTTTGISDKGNIVKTTKAAKATWGQGQE